MKTISPVGQGDASYPPGLSASNVGVPGLKEVLRHLGGLAASGVTRQDHHLVVFEGVDQLSPVLGHGQVGLALT